MSDKTYKDMSNDELKTELLSLRKEQFNLRMLKATSNAKSHLIKNVRKNIARVKTFMTQCAQTGETL